MTDTATKFTRRDYERLPEGFPCELIEGELVKEPAPVYRHQRVIGFLFETLLQQVGPERLVASPIDLFIDDHNVLQPDFAVFTAALDRTIRHIPTPAVVFEILSPSTAARDRTQKTRIYLRAGVAEVWLIDPETGRIEVHTKSGVTEFGKSDRVPCGAVPQVDLRGADLIR